MKKYNELLKIYNKIYNTNYVSIDEFASKLVRSELKKAYMQHRHRELAQQIEKEFEGE